MRWFRGLVEVKVRFGGVVVGWGTSVVRSGQRHCVKRQDHVSENQLWNTKFA